MRISAEFSTFLGDQSRQKRLRKDGKSWGADFTASTPISSLAVMLSNLSADPPANVPAFEHALQPWTQSLDWVYGCVDSWRAQLATDYFASLPMVVLANPVFLGLALASEGQANCTLSLVNSMALNDAQSPNLVFDSGYSMTVQIGGGDVVVERFRKHDSSNTIASIGVQALPWQRPIAIDCAVEQIRIISADRDAVLLRFSCPHQKSDQRVFEYDAQNGHALRVGASKSTTSRKMAIMQFLAMDADDLPLQEALMQLVNDSDAMLRWEAARHLANRFPEAAFPIIETMVDHDPNPDLRRVAKQVVDIFSMERRKSGRRIGVA